MHAWVSYPMVAPTGGRGTSSVRRMGATPASSRTETIEAHLPLVRSIAQRYVRHGEPLEDLVQAGTVGLIKAVDRFDPGRHRDLAALARPSIEGEIRHHLRDGGGGPHVPRTDRELAARVGAVSTELTARLHRPPTRPELAAAAGVDEARVVRALQAQGAARAVSLDERDGERTPARRAEAEAAEARVLLETGWERLDERERRLLELRYREDRSQSEIAAELGLSQAHVSRLLRAALDRLRAAVDPPEAAAGDGSAQIGPAPALSDPSADARSGRLLLRLPRTLHRDLAAEAEREGIPLNTFIAGTLAAAVGWQDPDGAPAAPSRRGRPTRLLVVNAIVIALAALAGVALLLAAWLG
ncbi:MAG: polymerase sigma-B factor [Baekduia sp.]|nr:polymerase sigma-B factor [Baekduia sp.]